MGLHELIGAPGAAWVLIGLLVVLGLLTLVEMGLRRRAPPTPARRAGPVARRARRGGESGDESHLWAIYSAHKSNERHVPGYAPDETSPEAMSVRLVGTNLMFHYQEAFDFFTNYLSQESLDARARGLAALGLHDIGQIVLDAKKVLSEFEKLDEIWDFGLPQYDAARNGMYDLMRRFEAADGSRRIIEAAGKYFDQHYDWDVQKA